MAGQGSLATMRFLLYIQWLRRLHYTLSSVAISPHPVPAIYSTSYDTTNEYHQFPLNLVSIEKSAKYEYQIVFSFEINSAL